MGKIQAKMCLQSLSETYNLGYLSRQIILTPLALCPFKLKIVLLKSAIAPVLLNEK